MCDLIDERANYLPCVNPPPPILHVNTYTPGDADLSGWDPGAMLIECYGADFVGGGVVLSRCGAVMCDKSLD